LKYKLKNRDTDHIDGVRTDGIHVEAIQWRPYCQMPGWSSYLVDPSALPGKLMILTPDSSEAIALNGDMIVNCIGGVIAVDPDIFFHHYREA